MSTLERQPAGPSAEIAELVRNEHVLACLAGSLAIVEAPAGMGCEWLLADDDGYHIPVWPGEITERIELLKAFARRTHAPGHLATSDCDPEDGDHDCWESMEHMEYKKGECTQTESEVVQIMFCRSCGSRYWRLFQAVTMTDSENKTWVTATSDGD